MVNHWQDLQIADKVRAILGDIHHHEEHHFGDPFVTAYQLAIEFALRYPVETQKIGMPVGGAGTGQRNSLSQYLAGELSKKIKSKAITDIEGAFLYYGHIKDLRFASKDGAVEASTFSVGFDLSMFRLKNPDQK